MQQPRRGRHHPIEGGSGEGPTEKPLNLAAGIASMGLLSAQRVFDFLDVMQWNACIAHNPTSSGD
jgi:hypothetical protein